MKSVVLGARGQVGSTLARELAARGTPALVSSRTPATGEAYVDFEKPETIRALFAEIARRSPGEPVQIFLTGAFTHVDGCELDPAKCMRINRDAPLFVAEECKAAGHELMFFSSEYVFGQAEYEGGAVGPFRETDPVAPSSVYGRAKAEAEAGILDILKGRAAIVRTTVVFSWRRGDMNFAMQLYRFLDSKLKNGKDDGLPAAFRIPTDQISTPTYAPALVEGVLELAERKARGIYHLVGADLLARSEFAERLIERFGFPREKCAPYLEFLKTADLKQPARRPLTAGLNADKARAAGIRIWSLDEAFREFRL